MASLLRPQFFCTRPNGTVTPLIAVDELPSHISIRGVSRALSANDTQGMTSLGTVNSRNQTYVVDGVPTAPMHSAAGNSAAAVSGGAGVRSRDYELQTSLVRILSDESIPANQRLALHSSIQQALAPQWAAGAAGASSVQTAAAGSWLVPAGGSGGRAGGPKQGPNLNVKKEYCSYWIRHGECDYQQQGCLYKHEMPTDSSMLEKLGLRDIPRWYREKHGVPSILPGGANNTRANTNNSQNWRDDAADSGMVKSIQYPARLRYNGTTTPSSDTEKASKQKPTSYVPALQQNNGNGTTMFPENPRASYPAMNPPRAPSSQRHGSRNVAGQSMGAPGARKIDLLSFDPLPDYPSLDALHGGMGGMTYPASSPGNNANNTHAKTPDEAHREGIVRNLQSLMPNTPDYLSTPLNPNQTQQRSKKTQKGRRLYQPRSQIVVPGDNQEIRDQASFRNAQHGNSTYSSAASVTSKGTNGSQVTSPIGVLGSSDPPTRVASPSTHSPTSLSSQSSPQAFYNKNKDGVMPGAIGSKRVYHRKKPANANSSEEDLFDFGIESANGHGHGN